MVKEDLVVAAAVNGVDVINDIILINYLLMYIQANPKELASSLLANSLENVLEGTF